MNTNDTPMDYKQFEGHTPGQWEVLSGYKKPWSVWSIKEQLLICARVHGNDYSQSSANAKLVAAAPDLLKENQELKLELQKQKELNDDLVKFVQELLDDHRNLCFMMDFENRAESLIKKSSET